VPAHAFWDIKKPIGQEQERPMNEYNPARQVHGADFFDIRKQYEYIAERDVKSNLKPSVSDHIKY
jgi:hypothetical protein